MANITTPIQVNLPDDWIKQIMNRLRNDPESEWVEIIRCKDCKHYKQDSQGVSYCYKNRGYGWKHDDWCSYGERKNGEMK